MRARQSNPLRKVGRTRAVALGERVLLRYPLAADRAEYAAVRLVSRAFLEPWEATPPGGPGAFTLRRFDQFLATSNTEVSHRFLVCLREPRSAVGQIGIGGIMRGAFQSGFIGYWIAQEFSRQGYMTEALGLALRIAFVRLKLHRVEANIIPSNTPSKSLVKRLGFRHEGLARRYLLINNRWQDHEHWVMTVEDWRATSAKVR